MELNQLKKEVKVIGKAKSIDRVREGQTRNGKDYLAYTLTVMVKNEKNNTLDEIRVEFFSTDGTAPYKSQTKYFNEAKVSDNVGYNDADLVSVFGELDLQEYKNRKTGKETSFNSIKGVFIHRLDEDMKHRAVANVETVITSIEDKLNEEDLPTGEKTLTGFTIGYNERIIELVGLTVPSSLADEISKIYKPHQTTQLTLQFINRAVNDDSQQEEQEEEVTSAFGTIADTDAGSPVFTSYDNRTLVIGGTPPFLDEGELSEDEIEQALKLRKEQKSKNLEVKDYTPKQETKKNDNTNDVFNQGFGSEGNDDVPDF